MTEPQITLSYDAESGFTISPTSGVLNSALQIVFVNTTQEVADLSDPPGYTLTESRDPQAVTLSNQATELTIQIDDPNTPGAKLSATLDYLNVREITVDGNGYLKTDSRGASGNCANQIYIFNNTNGLTTLDVEINGTVTSPSVNDGQSDPFTVASGDQVTISANVSGVKRTAPVITIGDPDCDDGFR